MIAPIHAVLLRRPASGQAAVRITLQKIARLPMRPSLSASTDTVRSSRPILGVVNGARIVVRPIKALVQSAQFFRRQSGVAVLPPCYPFYKPLILLNATIARPIARHACYPSSPYRGGGSRTSP